jgi:RNA polymerase sigma-70 factor (ECF subfamily)
MDPFNPDRLSQIQTLWTVVCQAHGQGPPEAVVAAQEQLLARYGKVVQRYLLGALRDPDVADELAQEFALRFVRGDLKGADPQRGRFRDFLKGTLFHLIGDWHRRRRKDPLPLPPEHDPAASAATSAESDEQFLASWRAELLDRAWTGLAAHKRESDQPFHRVLQFRAQHPELRSEEMAEQLSAALGRAVTAAWVRQTLHRAREKFADLLLDEIRQTLRDPSADDIEDELAAIGLHTYCQPALEKLRGG